MRPLAVVALGLLVLSQTAGAEEPAPSAVDLVVRDLCGKRIALLGEPPMHGFGKTLEFKVELVRRLVDECSFGAFFIESGAYDFLNIRKVLKAGQTVTPPMIAAAIGGLWANREVEPLIPFLSERVQRGVLVLGGLDDQIGRGTYAQNQMPADLVEFLPADERAPCLAILQKHTLWQYTREEPYDEKNKARILGCLDRIGTGVSARPTADRETNLAMVGNVKRWLARDFNANAAHDPDPRTLSFNLRDRSMYENFTWLMSRLPARSKVMVWTATIHAASDLSGVPGLETYVSLGSYLRREFKSEAFVLGFSAASGSYALGRQPAKPLDPAPLTSLEGQAVGTSGSDTRYLNSSQIRKPGRIAARPLGPDFLTAKWDDVLDGLVVFREEHPPHFSAR